MRQAMAVLVLVGLAMAGGSVAANAAPITAPPAGTICHATEAGVYEPALVSSHGMIHDLGGHKGHVKDIIPFPGVGGPNGQNMTPENVAIFNNGCVGTVAEPDEPEDPAEAADPAEAGDTPAAVPKDATLPAPKAKNLGYNVDGAVQAKSGDALPVWLTAAAGLLPAAAALVVWRIRVRARSAVR